MSFTVFIYNATVLLIRPNPTQPMDGPNPCPSLSRRVCEYGKQLTSCRMLFKGDGLSYHLGRKFTTRDQDNDPVTTASCAVQYKGAWWYRTCHRANLNGLYLRGNHSFYGNGVQWYYWTGFYYSLRFTEMKVKPYNC